LCGFINFTDVFTWRGTSRQFILDLFSKDYMVAPDLTPPSESQPSQKATMPTTASPSEKIQPKLAATGHPADSSVTREISGTLYTATGIPELSLQVYSGESAHKTPLKPKTKTEL
jgi:hypothetical protein